MYPKAIYMLTALSFIKVQLITRRTINFWLLKSDRNKTWIAGLGWYWHNWFVGLDEMMQLGWLIILRAVVSLQLKHLDWMRTAGWSKSTQRNEVWRSVSLAMQINTGYTYTCKNIHSNALAERTFKAMQFMTQHYNTKSLISIIYTI